MLVPLEVRGVNGRHTSRTGTQSITDSHTRTHSQQADGVFTGCSEHPHLAELYLREEERERERDGRMKKRSS